MTGAGRLERLQQAVLYGILDTGYLAGRDPRALAQAMVAGGCDIIQVRAKRETTAELENLSRLVEPVVHAGGALLIVNDHPELVGSTGADGAHIGQDDGTVASARSLMPEGTLLGKSTHSVDQAVATELEKPDYIGLGPLYATPTKPDYVPVGLPLIRQVGERVAVPTFCIGGIKLENLAEVVGAGARRVVVVSGILQADDIVMYCQKLKALLSGS
jgi:thiamine-phosphate pyrophosphorylase